MRSPDIALDTGPVDLVHDSGGLLQDNLPVEPGISLGDDHVGQIPPQVLVHQITGRVGVALGNPVPLVEDLQTQMTRARMHGEGETTISFVVFHEVIAATDGADGLVELRFVHSNRTDPFFQFPFIGQIQMVDQPSG